MARRVEGDELGDASLAHDGDGLVHAARLHAHILLALRRKVRHLLRGTCTRSRAAGARWAPAPPAHSSPSSMQALHPVRRTRMQHVASATRLRGRALQGRNESGFAAKRTALC